MAKLSALVKAGVVNTEGYYTLGGRLAIDFANSHERIGQEADGLSTFEDLLTFLKSHGHLHEDEASDLHMFLFQNPGRCQAVVDSLTKLRTTFKSVLTQMAQGWPADPGFFEEINSHLAVFKSFHKVVPTEDGMELKSVIAEEGPEKLLFPIIRDIADFLASDHPEKTKICANDDCGLYFVNLSRNGRRRWCSMSTCGNRAKVNAYLKRQEA
ncbi:CGNR zinc finger domain-containing protein [Sneathiella marina]|uniref:CGNR zinc finger domain-containing protein n=1 Tax=Sneathiella marina TaxID=2950108 RepID=A0ABY4WCW0_9PROT|nr:CGNR zinc finger domain-containing protein [Sneathiella marina]USG63094.1 CGNR zinc finger domain-containing protein [Sneathiella marina]